MRTSFVFLAIVAGVASATASAQMSGGAPSGPQPDIRNSDLGSHDSFSTPDMHDMLLKQRERELSDKLSAQQNSGGPSRPAKANELLAGASVNDKTGAPMAKIAEVDADGVVVSMGMAKVKVPAQAFGHNKAACCST
jgi:hypothetical protein